MKWILTVVVLSSIVLFTGCGDDTADNNATYGILGDSTGEYNSTNTQTNDGYVNPELGTQVNGDSQDDSYVNPNLGTQINGQNGDTLASYNIESFRDWYATTCGEVFNDALYNSSTGKYNGTINCGGKDLYTIDLNYMSVFTSIKDINLSHNHLGTIDFTPFSNTNVIEVLDISYNELDNDIDFSPLFNLHNINELWIQGNNIHYTRAEREELYRGFNNRSLYIGF